MSSALLIDNSAWARLTSPSLPAARLAELADLIEAGEVAVCLPFLLEAGYSSRASDHGDTLDELLALPYLELGEAVERRALDAQRQLARAGQHRLPPVDLLIAALADQSATGVLHFDSGYDLIRARTDLEFESVWLAERGLL